MKMCAVFLLYDLKTEGQKDIHYDSSLYFSTLRSRLCPIAIGCDGGGSVRIPSSYCGIYGLKPTQGRISGRGEYPLAPTVAISGPMCASMEDLSIVYAIIAGRDNQVPFTLF